MDVKETYKWMYQWVCTEGQRQNFHTKVIWPNTGSHWFLHSPPWVYSIICFQNCRMWVDSPEQCGQTEQQRKRHIFARRQVSLFFLVFESWTELELLIPSTDLVLGPGWEAERPWGEKGPGPGRRVVPPLRIRTPPSNREEGRWLASDPAGRTWGPPALASDAELYRLPTTNHLNHDDTLPRTTKAPFFSLCVCVHDCVHWCVCACVCAFNDCFCWQQLLEFRTGNLLSSQHPVWFVICLLTDCSSSFRLTLYIS